MEITASGTYVYFEDKKLEQILKEHYANGLDGILVTLQVDANNGFYDNRTHIFAGNTEITTFDELNQFQYIKKIGEWDFRNCTNLRSINLTNITSIGLQAFEGDTSLAIDINLPNCITLSSHCFRQTAIPSITNIGNVTEIPFYCFYQCTSLETIAENALSNITTIGENAFAGCTLLENVSGLQSLRTINTGAFSWCTSLQSFEFNENITSIGKSVFENDTLLIIDDLNLPNLTSIGASAFKQTRIKKVSNLGSITNLGTTEWGGGRQFQYCNTLTSVTLPNTITSIGDYVFEECTNLTSINLPQTITHIGNRAFYNCSNLNIELNLPNLNTLYGNSFRYAGIKKIISLGNLTEIGQYIFINCTSLIYADLTGITIIGDTTFSGCTSLTTVISPDLTTLWVNAFSGCTSLTSIDLSKCTIIYGRAFKGCSSLGTVDLSKVTYIGDFAFSGCSSLKLKTNERGYYDLTSLEYIATCAFEWLWSTEPYPTIDFGENISEINGYTIFRDSRASFIFRCSVVPNAHGSTDPLASNKTYSKIYVLDNLVDTYKATWTDAASQIHPLSEIEP